ncbi:MAG: response regulator, partial [Brevundimonas sp.]
MPDQAAACVTVLMVEDNAEVLEFGATVLAEAGYAVVTAVTGDEAMERVRQGLRVDLLFTDIVMPGALDGVALARAVGEMRPATLILLTTGWADRMADQTGGREPLPLIGKPYRAASVGPRTPRQQAFHPLHQVGGAIGLSDQGQGLTAPGLVGHPIRPS